MADWVRIMGVALCVAVGLGGGAVASEDWPDPETDPRQVATNALTSAQINFPPPTADTRTAARVLSAADIPDAAWIETPQLAEMPSDLSAPLTEDELAPLELDPTIIEQSPVLRRWLEETPDIADEIRHQPSFRTRLRLGYANFPSSGEIGGFQLGIEDVFVWRGTGLTLSGDYSRSYNGQRESYGAAARYYLLPLGGYVNLAPSIGYRSVSTADYSADGVDLGIRLMLVPSRGGAADLALSQHWVAPGSDQEVGITSLTLGYAVTRQIRLGSDLQFQNSRFGQDSRWGLSLEWLL